MSEVLINGVTAAMFAALAFGLLRPWLPRWRARLARESADRDELPNVPLWVAVAAGLLILGLAALLADAYFGPAG
jgi:hypothetical protein